MNRQLGEICKAGHPNSGAVTEAKGCKLLLFFLLENVANQCADIFRLILLILPFRPAVKGQVDRISRKMSTESLVYNIEHLMIMREAVKGDHKLRALTPLLKVDPVFPDMYITFLQTG